MFRLGDKVIIVAPGQFQGEICTVVEGWVRHWFDYQQIHVVEYSDGCRSIFAEYELRLLVPQNKDWVVEGF